MPLLSSAGIPCLVNANASLCLLLHTAFSLCLFLLICPFKDTCLWFRVLLDNPGGSHFGVLSLGTSAEALGKNPFLTSSSFWCFLTFPDLTLVSVSWSPGLLLFSLCVTSLCLSLQGHLWWHLGSTPMILDSHFISNSLT